mmetsp:Transcript_21831/g.58250  ORF Transcript_21831/g.58250 Transcript_21831/m.58250 type:complete len:98 (-) Transcript_21831:195-488(-)
MVPSSIARRCCYTSHCRDLPPRSSLAIKPKSRSLQLCDVKSNSGDPSPRNFVSAMPTKAVLGGKLLLDIRQWIVCHNREPRTQTVTKPDSAHRFSHL